MRALVLVALVVPSVAAAHPPPLRLVPVAVEAKVEREVAKLRRSVDRLVERVDAWVVGGESVAIEAGELRVRVQLVEQGDARASLRLVLTDAAGEPLQTLQQARLVTAAGVSHDLAMAGPGELVIEDLAVAEGATVTLVTADGDGLLLWVDDAGVSHRAVR